MVVSLKEEAIKGIRRGYGKIHSCALQLDIALCHRRSKSYLMKAAYLTQCGTV